MATLKETIGGGEGLPEDRSELRPVDPGMFVPLFDENDALAQHVLPVLLDMPGLKVCSSRAEHVLGLPEEDRSFVGLEQKWGGTGLFAKARLEDGTSCRAGFFYSKALPGELVRLAESAWDLRIGAELEEDEQLPDAYLCVVTEDPALAKEPCWVMTNCVAGPDGQKIQSNLFADGRHTRALSGLYTGDGSERGRMVHDLLCNDPDAMHCRELADEVRAVRRAQELYTHRREDRCRIGLCEDMYRLGFEIGYRQADGAAREK